MKDVENNIERLIVRALDGEINEDDQLALNRELIRNPDARRLMEEYRHIDEMTALALGETLNNDPLPLDVADLPDQRAIQDSPRNIHRTWWLAVGAVAAGLLAAVSARYFVSAPAQSIVANDTAQANRVQHIPPLSPSYHPQDDVVRNAGMNNKPRIKRSAGRDAFGVMGDDGNIYWIEVDRVWTLKKARPGTVLGRSSEGL